ncbi:hypothetical protein [Spirosoma sp.]|uniref:hypothetical protein n=1 Tax=Spirosoma sp. TaxID=1899569 RepID=UPI003B3BD4BD
MEPLNVYAEPLNHLPVDLRAEVVLADMLDDGVTLDDLIVNPVGLFKRPYGRDISRVAWVEAQHKARRWLQIDLNRSGLYDLLPEGVFHQPTSHDTSSSKESTLREMAIQHEREQQARRFFLPFEQEFFRLRVRIEQEQRNFLFGDDNHAADVALDWFWGLPSFLTPIQRIRLRYLLPIMHQIVGNLSLMEACFGQLIDERVSLQIESSEQIWLLSDTPTLGQWQLGVDSVFDGWITDGEPILSITVHIDQPDKLMDYLPGTAGHRLLNWLTGYIVPMDLNSRLKLDTSALADTFVLAEEDALGRLDFTTFI